MPAAPVYKEAELTVLMVDVRDSSRQWVRDAAGMAMALDDLARAVRAAARQTHGRVVKCIGDAFMLVFDAPEQGVACAFRLQSRREAARRRGLQLRIGVAHGPVLARRWAVQGCAQWDYFGNTVNTASRLESRSSPVGGFAVGLTPSRPELRERVEAALELGRAACERDGATARVAAVRYRARCGAGAGAGAARGRGLVRSARLVPFSQQRCEPLRGLHGVAALEAYVVTLRQP